MPTKTYDEIHQKAHNRLSVRKAQRSFCYIGRKSLVEPIDFNDYGPEELPDFEELGYKALGNITTDGFNFGREETNSEVESHGITEIIRIDTDQVNRTISTTVQNTQSRLIREIADGTDYSGVSFSANGFLVLDENDMPEHDDWVIVILFRDGPAARRFIWGRQFHEVQLQTAGDETHGGDGELNQELTWRVFTDRDKGTPVTKFYGGAGFVELVEELDWDLEDAEGN